MKKLLLILLVLLAPASAFCQVGYFGLRYGESFADARATLEGKGFLMIFNRGELRKFAIDPAPEVFVVDLIMDPATEALVGWVVYFNDKMSDEDQNAVLERIKQLHGASFVMDEASGILGAPLENGREVSVAFTDNGDLAMCVYYDEQRKDIFDASSARNEEWQALHAQD